ncbi:phage Gp37/Gp68 family protein [bacterium]|nr:phage Gp37/Gp68 family protein [bacterium]
MSINSAIEWTESTWNPVTGCSKVSEGCRYCYAETMTRRLKAMGQPNYQAGFSVRVHPDVVDKPRSWKKPQIIFVNSMSDLFHPDVPLEFIQSVFTVMRETPHLYQILTKRDRRLAKLAPELEWADNIWMGVSVENYQVVKRIDSLRATPAKTKFLSVEPLIGPTGPMNLDGIGWVIVGGESGPKARPMDPAWVQDVLRQCRDARVPFFFKQWGGRNKKAAGRTLNGTTYDNMPDSYHAWSADNRTAA